MDKLQFLIPEFEAPKAWKDEEKIRANIESQREKWVDDAALSPITGEILAAVWVDVDGMVMIADADEIGERELIQQILVKISEGNMGSHYKVAGFNISEFDIPWLIRRAWHHGISLPTGLIKARGKWLDLPDWMIDIRHLWGMNERFAKGDLGAIAEFLGVGSKQGKGKDFHRNWRDPSMHAEAMAYLLNDGNVLPKIFNHIVNLSPDQYGLNLQPYTKEKNETRIPR